MKRLAAISRHLSTIPLRSKLIPDYLTPTHSHLLSSTLSDLLASDSGSGLDSGSGSGSGSVLHTVPPTIQSPPKVLPQGHHLVYFPLLTPPSQLAPDGADPDHSPGAEWPKRLWAGGEVTFRKGWEEQFVLDGREVECVEEIGDVKDRGGVVFVDLWRRYGQRESWGIEERRTLAFLRDGEGKRGRGVKYPHPPDYITSFTPTPTHLFNFSALTYNAHSIHIDPLYARQTDGHRERLVHGPLSLSLMLRVLGSQVEGGKVTSLSYRNYAPLYVNEEMSVAVRRLEDKDGVQRWDVWVEGQEGMAVKGTAVVDMK